MNLHNIIMNDIKCFFGLHKYEVIKETNIYNEYNNTIGIMYIVKCTNCGKISSVKVYNKICN